MDEKSSQGNGDLWRTDIFKTTLADPGLKETEFVLANGSGCYPCR